MQASGYSPRPVGFGEALGVAMQQGQQAEMQANTLAFQKEQFAETQSQNQAANFLANKKLDIEIEKLLEFCELELDDNCFNHHKNSKTPIKTVSISQARQAVYSSSVRSSANYQDHLKEMFENLI